MSAGLRTSLLLPERVARGLQAWLHAEQERLRRVGSPGQITFHGLIVSALQRAVEHAESERATTE